MRGVQFSGGRKRVLVILNGAKLLGWEGQIGALEPGYLADVVAVAGDPLQDIGVLQNISFVMKGGVVYKK